MHPKLQLFNFKTKSQGSVGYIDLHLCARLSRRLYDQLVKLVASAVLCLATASLVVEVVLVCVILTLYQCVCLRQIRSGAIAMFVVARSHWALHATGLDQLISNHCCTTRRDRNAVTDIFSAATHRIIQRIIAVMFVSSWELTNCHNY